MIRIWFILIVVLLAQGASLQAQWIRISDTINYPVLCILDGSLVGTDGGGIFRSTNEGVSWSNEVVPTGKITALMRHGDNALSAAWEPETGVRISTDHGATWSNPRPVTEGAHVTSMTVMWDTLYVGTYDHGVFRSTVGGVARGDDWIEMNNGELPERILSMAVNGVEVYAGTPDGVYRSAYSSGPWRRMSDSLRDAVNVLAVTQGVLQSGTGKLFAGTESGVYHWLVNEKRWIPYGLAGMKVTGLVAWPHDVYAATADRGVFWLSPWIPWRPINDGLDNLQLSTLHAGDGFFAGSADGEIWTRDMGPVTTDVEEIASQPPSSIPHVSPNPVTSSITLTYQLDTRSPVTITIYDALGRIISRPVSEAMQERGYHRIVLETHGLAAGMYFCSVKEGGVERAASFVVAH